MTLVIGGGGGFANAKILIDDQDGTLVSGFIGAAFAQQEMAELFSVVNVDAVEGANLMDAGEASGLLTIPAGFQHAFLNGTPKTLTLKTNPAELILPGIIESVAQVLLDGGFYLHALFGDQLEQIQAANGGDAPSSASVSAIAMQINEKMNSVGPGVFPPAFDLQIVEPPPIEPETDFGLLFLPGIVIMGLLFASQGLSSDFWKEREQGTLRRLLASPGLLNQFVIGKAVAAAVVLLFISGMIMLAGFIYHDVAWSKLPSSMLWVVVAGIGFFAWFSALQMLFSSRKGADLLGTIILFPLMMMGGSFFPLEALPDWLASLGRLSPNGFVVVQLSTELTSDTSWSYDLKAWAIVVAMSVSGLAACSWRLKSGFARQG